MQNLLNYIYWRGDLSFGQDPFNEIDAVILAGFSYINFNLLDPDLRLKPYLTIKEAGQLWTEADKDIFMPTGYLHFAECYDLLILAGASKRFGDLQIVLDIKEVSAEDESQFGVTIFHKDNEPCFIAFEGTDLRTLGWKEDLKMTYLPTIPAQTKAVDFLNRYFERYPQAVSIGGHSKGSNLAIYGAINISPQYQHLIENIYSFDGPGFAKSVLEDDKYLAVKDKIKAFVPQDSIIGLMLYKLESQTVVFSSEKEIKQHDFFSWQIKGNQFVEAELSDTAKDIRDLVNNTLDELSLEERHNFSEALFSILGDNEDDYIIGDLKFTLERIPILISKFNKLDNEAKGILFKVFRLFYRGRFQIK